MRMPSFKVPQSSLLHTLISREMRAPNMKMPKLNFSGPKIQSVKPISFPAFKSSHQDLPKSQD